MRVGLIQIDGKLPNLSLMKISAYWKGQGAEVVFPWDYQDMFCKVDKAYAAVIFDWNRNKAKRLLPYGVEIGGTGWDLVKNLPDEINSMMPDYSIYGIDYGMGYTSTGCIRRCPFCVVWRKEGEVKEVCMPVDLLNENKELVLLDGNFLASPKWEEKSKQIIDNGIHIDFTQGLDLRLVDEKKAEYIAAMKHKKRIHFAWDDVKTETQIRAGLELLLKNGIHPDKISLFVLCNYDSTFDQDLHRVNTLIGYGVNPYVMIYDRKKAPHEIKALGRWCNRAQIRRSCSFEDYDRR